MSLWTCSGWLSSQGMKVWPRKDNRGKLNVVKLQIQSSQSPLPSKESVSFWQMSLALRTIRLSPQRDHQVKSHIPHPGGITRKSFSQTVNNFPSPIFLCTFRYINSDNWTLVQLQMQHNKILQVKKELLVSKAQRTQCIMFPQTLCVLVLKFSLHTGDSSPTVLPLLFERKP